MPTRVPASRDQPVALSKTQVKKVAVIGGGASGAIVLDSLVREGHFDEIVLFERRAVFGGVWVFDDKAGLDPVPSIRAGATREEIDPPLANPFGTETETRDGDGADNDANGRNHRSYVLPRSKQERFELTPAYQRMKTNIIENMMTYSDEKHWLESGQQLPEKYADRHVVQQYIARYIQRNQHHDRVRVETSTAVEDVARVARPGADLDHQFRLTLRQQLENGADLWYQDTFDSVVVATGHYHIPYTPEVPGSRAVQDAFPGVFEHAKFFTTGERYKGKTVVVVGSRASGTDLTRFTSDYATRVYQSIRSNPRKLSERANVHSKPEIAEFRPTASGFQVVFADGSVVEDPDHVIFATGYQFSYPFLQRALGDITCRGSIVPQLYQHTFLVGEPLLSIVGVPTDAISFRAFEFQAVLVARFLAGKVALPPPSVQDQWLQTRYKQHGESRSYHTIGAQEARNYMNELSELGALKNPADTSGRPFPVTTEAEVEEYVAAGQALREMWR